MALFNFYFMPEGYEVPISGCIFADSSGRISHKSQLFCNFDRIPTVLYLLILYLTTILSTFIFKYEAT
jgi:hypothetical protein